MICRWFFLCRVVVGVVIDSERKTRLHNWKAGFVLSGFQKFEIGRA
jgi:hypothetical protein